MSEFNQALKTFQRRLRKGESVRRPRMRCPKCGEMILRTELLNHLDLDQDHRNFYWTEVIKRTPTALKLKAMQDPEVFIRVYNQLKRKRSPQRLRVDA